MVNTPTRLDEICDVSARFIGERAVGITATLPFGQCNPTGESGTEAKIKDAHNRPGLPEEKPDAELLFTQVPEKNGHQHEAQQNTHASAKPTGGCSKGDAAGDTQVDKMGKQKLGKQTAEITNSAFGFVDHGHENRYQFVCFSMQFIEGQLMDFAIITEEFEPKLSFSCVPETL
jgi:hypothetical protein